MPTSLTHQLLAEEVYASLPNARCEEIASLAHYYLGAQGADICFFCPPFSKKRNLGHVLHGRSSLLFFRLLRRSAKTDPLVRSYAYGYITHYAADTVFHPFVRASSGGKNGPLSHHFAERACDAVLWEEHRGNRPIGRGMPDLSTALCPSIYEVYRRYALLCGYGELSYESFVRAGKLYLAAACLRLPYYKKEKAYEAKRLFLRAKERSLRLADSFAEGRLREENFDKRLSDGGERAQAEAGTAPILQKKG